MRFQVLLLSVLGAFSLTRASVAADVDPAAANTNSTSAAPAVVAASTDTAPTNAAPTANAVAATNAVTSTNTVPAAPAPIVAAAPEPPAPVTTNAPVANTGIRFDFNGMPYADALQRFAQMAGKPLIADTAVEGTLTFSDPKPYTYGEALDTLNLILSTKNVMLVEADRYLRLVPFKALPQMPLKLLHGLANIGDVRPGEIVTVVLDLKNLDAGELSQPISSMLSSAGSVASLSRGRGLIVTDRLENIQRVRQLLTEIDTASPVQRQVKTFNLRRVSGTLMADLLNRTFGIATAPKRTVFNEQRKSYEVLPPDPTDYVTAIFAEASNTLVLFGPSERIAMASDLIDRFESEAGARASEIKVFYPQMPVEELAGMIRQAIPGIAGRGDRGGDNETKAKVIADTTSNRLIVTAPAAGQLDAITALIQRLDPSTQETAPTKTPGGAAPTRELRVVDLKSGSAQALAPMLREAMTDLGRNQTGPTAMAQVRIQAAPFGNRLLLTGTPDALNDVMRLVEQLDTVSEPAEVTRVFKLRNSNAGRLANLIMSAMGGYGGRRRAGGGFVAAASEDRSNCLIVAASEAQMKTIEELVKQLEEVGGDAGRQLKIVELTNNSASTVAGTLSRLFVPQVNAYDPTQRIVVTPTPNDRALVVEADEKMMPRIEEAVKTLDTATATAGIELRVVEVKSGSAQALGSMLREAIDELGRDRSRGGVFSQVHVQPSPVGNRLLLTGPAEALDRVEKLIGQLDNVQTAQTTRVFKLKSADARQVANMIMGAMGGYEARRRGGGGYVAAAAEERSNCVIVSAPDAQMKLVEDVINRLEEAGSLGGRQLKMFALTNNSAASVVTTLRQLFVAQVNTYDPAKRVSLTAAPNDQAILIEAGEDMMPRLAEAVKMLDAETVRAGVELRVVEIKSGSAQALAPMLQQALGELSRQGGGAGVLTQVHVQPSPVGNRLLVSGPTEALDRVGKLIEQLDNVETTQATKVFKMKNADARQVANMIMSAMGGYESRRRGGAGVSAAAEERSNCVVVSAPDAQMKLVEEVITRLDEAGGTGGRQLKILPVTNNSAASIAAMVAQLFFPQIRTSDASQRIAVTAAPDDRALVVEAEDTMMARLEEAVKALDVEPARGTIEVRTYALPEGRSADLAASLSRLFTEQDSGRRRFDMAGPPTPPAPRFELDGASEMLIVAATAEQFVRIEKVLDDLRAAAAMSSQIRTFRLEHAEPSQVVDVLQSMLLGDTPPQRWRGARGFQGGTGTAELRIAAAPALNAVVVQASPEKLAVATQLIKTLDKPRSDGAASVQTVHLQKAQADAVASAVTQALTAKNPPNTPPSVSVTAVPGSRSLLVNGPELEVVKVIQLIHDLDQESPSDQPQTRVYRLENGDAREMARVMTQLLQGLSRAQPRFASRYQRDNFTVAADDRTNSLIVSGTPECFALVEQLLPTLDQSPQHSDRQVQFYWLQNADAFDVATKADALFADRPKAERPVIEPDSFANSLTVVAKPADLVDIEAVVQKLDSMARDTSLVVRMIPLTEIPVERMATMLTNIYAQMSDGQIRFVDRLPTPPPRPVAPPATGSTNAPAAPQTNAPAASPVPVATPAPVVTIAVDKTANALIASGPAYELDHIQSLVTELTLSFATPEFEIRQFRLKEADPVVVARVLNELFKPTPVPGQPQNQQGQTQRGRQRGENGGGQGRQAQGNQPPGQPQQPQQPGQPPQIAPPKVAVVAESRTHSVIVRARPADFALLESIIKQLDEGGLSAELAHRLVPLQHVTPERVMPLVRQMLTQLNTTRPGEPVAIAGDPRSRGIFLVGRESVLDQVEALVHELDTSSEFAEIEVRVFPLKNAQAAPLATLLKDLFRPDSANEVSAEARQLQEQVSRLKLQDEHGNAIGLDLTQPIKILADPPQATAGGANRLVIGSTPTNLQALAAVVGLLDQVPLAEGITARIVRLQHVDASIVAQTLNSIFQQGQQTAPNGGARRGGGPGRLGRAGGAAVGALGSALNVAVDTRSNLLVLSGQEETITLAEAIIKDLDRDADVAVSEVRLFHLDHATATRLVPMLRAVFTEGGGQGGRGLAGQVSRLRTVIEGKDAKTTEQAQARAAISIQADDASSTVIVAARSDVMPLVADVIHTLDTPAAAGAESFRIFPLNHADAASVLRVLTELARGQSNLRSRPEDRPSLSVDDRTNALIASGTEKAIELVAKLVEQLDRDLPDDLRSIRILPLQNADATVIATSLQRLLDERNQQRGGGGRSGGSAMRVVVIADARSNSLLVSGGPDNYELVKSLVTQLDQPGSSLVGQVRLIPLQHADSGTLATTLSDLFTRRYQAARTPELQRNRPVILSDPRSNSLLVAAGMDDNAALDVLLQKLDREPENPAIELTVVGLQFNDSARVAATIQGVFAARLQSLTPTGQRPAPSDRVDVQADSLSNALVISANKPNLELIRGLIAKLDAEPMATGGMIQTFTLQHADVQRVAAMLATLVQQGVYRPGISAAGGRRSPREALAVAADPQSNTLIVSASPENLVIVKELIKQLDTAEYNATSDIKLYPLKHARASHLATVLEQFFRAKRSGEAAGGGTQRSVPVTVTADDRTNVLLITGSKESFAAVDRMVEQLDTEFAVAKTNFRVFELKHTTATKLQSTLQRLFANRPTRVQGEAPEPVTVIADGWSNALIIGASDDDLTLAASLIEKLDTEQPTGGPQVQVFQLAKADARRVEQTLQSLFRGTSGTAGPTAGGGLSPVVINVDERLNAIIVSAGETDLKRVAELVKKLDTDQVARVAEIRIFPLQNARAAEMALVLNNVLNFNPKALTDASPNRQSLLQFMARTEKGEQLITSALKEGIIIVPDPRANSLVVSAPLDYMDLLDRMIRHLDETAPTVAKIKIFNLKNADARQMALVLTSLFRLQPAGGPAAANQQFIQYTMPPGGTNAVATPTGSEENGAVMGSAEEDALSVTVDLRTNSLLIGGTEHYVELATQIIETLDGTPAQERKAQVYRLKNARSQAVETSLRTFLQQDLQRITSILGPSGVGTAQNILDREVSIVSETNSNTLLISASPRYFEEVEKLVEELDQPQPQVLIQVLLAEVTLDSTTELGVEWNYASKGNPSVGTGTDFAQQKLLQDFGGYWASITGSNYKFLLRALQNEGRLEVLSRPQILTADNQEATINIGQRVPVVTANQVTPQGGTINQFTYENVGVILQVTPRISPDGYVKMDLSPSVSDLSSSTVDISPGLSVRIINQRTATTAVTVKSGESVLIGGLIGTIDDVRTKKVPLLGDIPGLGVLFRSRTNAKTRKELLIVLTPQILLKGTGEAAGVDAHVFTDQELKASDLKNQIHRDPLQKRIIDPLYPEGANPDPKPGETKPKEPAK